MFAKSFICKPRENLPTVASSTAFAALLALGWLALATSDAQATLVVCVGSTSGPIVDGGPGDPDGQENGIIAFACVFPTGTASGTTRTAKTPTSLLFNISPLILTGTGNNAELARDTYNFQGAGIEWARIQGQLESAVNPPPPGLTAVGPEFLQLIATATTFNNNSATAQWGPLNANPPLPVAINGYNEREGFYGGQGIATGHASWDAGPVGISQINLPNSGDLFFEAPEPASGLLFLIASVLGIRRRK